MAGLHGRYPGAVATVLTPALEARILLYYSKGNGQAGVWRVPIDGGLEEPVIPAYPAGSYYRFWALVEDGTIESGATSLVNVELGYRLSSRIRISVDAFNLLDASDSDIDYYYGSRLAGEPPGGIDDFHLHPALPRTARINLNVAF